MTTMPAFQEAVEIAKQSPDLGIGIHLTLTAGRPLLENAGTITDEHGNFLSQAALSKSLDTIDLDEVGKEFTAQIEKALAAGLRPTHLDGHHHVHLWGEIRQVTAALCKKYGLGCRLGEPGNLRFLRDQGIRTTDCFSADFYGDNVSQEKLMEMIQSCDGDTMEIMCHPAYVDLPLYQASSYSVKRIFELDALTGGGIKQFLGDHGIDLCTYGDLCVWEKD